MEVSTALTSDLERAVIAGPLGTMKSEKRQSTGSHPERQSRIGVYFSLVAMLAYGGFLAAGALAPHALAQPAIGRIPWSFLLSVGLLVGAVALTGVYTLLMNAGEAE